jgi:hypothetical protein
MHLTPDGLDRLVLQRVEEEQKAPATNNVTVACFVTSQARIRLFEYLEQLVKQGCNLFYGTIVTICVF